MLRRRVAPRLLVGAAAALVLLAAPAVATANIPLTSGTSSDLTAAIGEMASDCGDAWSSISATQTEYLRAGHGAWPSDCDDVYAYEADDGTVYFATGADATDIMEAYEDALATTVSEPVPYSGSDGYGGTLQGDGAEGVESLTAAEDSGVTAGEAALPETLLDDGLIGASAVSSALPLAVGGTLYLDFEAVTAGTDPLAQWLGIPAPASECSSDCGDLASLAEGSTAFLVPPDYCLAPDQQPEPATDGDTECGDGPSASDGIGALNQYPPRKDASSETGDLDYITAGWSVVQMIGTPSEVHGAALSAQDLTVAAQGMYCDESGGGCGVTPTGDVCTVGGATIPGNNVPVGPATFGSHICEGASTWLYMGIDPVRADIASHHKPAAAADDNTVTPTASACADDTCGGDSLTDPSVAPVPQTVIPGFTTEPAFSPLVVPTPTPNELWTDYDDTLVADGFSDVEENVLSDADEDTSVGPSAVAIVTPAPGTRVPPDTELNVDVNPDDAPEPALGGGGFIPPPTLPGFELPRVPVACNVFPFGIPCWLVGILGQLNATPVAPNFSLDLAGYALRVDLASAWGGAVASVYVYVRIFFEVSSLVYLVLWLGRFVGFGAPPEGFQTHDDGEQGQLL
jgi:hypothetical protein